VAATDTQAPVLLEGSHAIAEAAIRARCRFYAGYPITPSTEILEYMSARMPEVGGVCMNAESELEAINMVWGAAGCGVRAMIASTGQGISLMQESFAELANAEIPCVIVNMMRGQGDYYQATRGGGHGDYRHIVLAPHTVQEAVELVGLGFHLADRWRLPVVLLGDFVLGHTSEAVEFRPRDERDLPPKTWAATGAAGRPALNVTPLGAPTKLRLDPGAHHTQLAGKYPRIAAAEARAETELPDDADVAVVAFGSPARFLRYAVHVCRERGLRVGFVRPITLWPFPDAAIAASASRVRAIGVWEQNAGQMIDDVRLAVAGRVPVVPLGGISHDHSGFGVGPALEPARLVARLAEWCREAA
jgi:2-oxoglutarate/2-oxoacid ferredoxin oxidoreductase subunit alpha